MTLSPVNKKYSASVRGIITEGNELTPIEHSTLDESNYELLHDGTRRRRRPLLPEKNNPTGYRPVAIDTAVSSYLWSTPAREENVSIVAEETQGVIRFYWLDHENLEHVSENQLDDELALTLFGRYASSGPLGLNGPSFEFGKPSTYTEGNGSLYVFNQFSGTIKVDLIDRDNRVLRFTPVGTWTRDFEGADETLDLYHRLPLDVGLTGYNGQPLLPDFTDDFLHEDFPNNRAYNLSNMGWPGEDIVEFVKQSDAAYTVTHPIWPDKVIPTQPREYPAFMDRYLDGRTVSDEIGSDSFYYGRLVEAPKRRGEPTKGARIGHSDYHPAGTLQPVPIDKTASAALANPFAIAGNLFMNVSFEEPFVHSIGRADRNVALFVHYVVLSCTRISDGKTFMAGMTGVFDADSYAADGKSMTVTLTNGNFFGFNNFAIEALYAHPSPVFTPHKLTSADDTPTYDYRGDRRPQAGAFYAGRLWQFGDEHNRLYFSQLIPESTQGRDTYDVQRESLCYMENSPTDGDDNFIVATDGGYVVISDSGTHLQGEVLLGSLIISTDNGLWEIKGTDRSGVFKPDAFSVRRLTQSEVLGHKAMVNLGNEMHVAADEGIIRIFPDERTGVLKTEVMTNTTIKSLYDDLVDQDRSVVGAYDPDSRTVRWAFPLTGTYTSTVTTSSSPMLSYSLQHNAWYKYDFGFGGTVADMLVLPYTIKNPTYNRFRYLVVGLNLLGTPEPLHAEWGIEAELGPTGPNEWVEFHDPAALFADFRDPFINPQERFAPEAFMLTNHYLYGDGQRWEHINYVTAYNREVTTHWIGQDLQINGDYLSYDPNITGSTTVQALWDWFVGTGRGKHTKPQETYRYRRHYFADVSEANPVQDRDEDLLVAKQKVRGRGREFRLRWAATDHLDSHIVGWSIEGLVSTTI